MAKQDKDKDKKAPNPKTVRKTAPKPVSKLPNLTWAVIICLQLLTVFSLLALSVSKPQPVIVQVPMQVVSISVPVQPTSQVASPEVVAAVVEQPKPHEIRIFSNGSVETVTVD